MVYAFTSEIKVFLAYSAFIATLRTNMCWKEPHTQGWTDAQTQLNHETTKVRNHETSTGNDFVFSCFRDPIGFVRPSTAECVALQQYARTCPIGLLTYLPDGASCYNSILP